MRLLSPIFVLQTVLAVMSQIYQGDVVGVITDMSGLSREDLKVFPVVEFPNRSYDVPKALYLFNNNRKVQQKADRFYSAFRNLNKGAKDFMAKLFYQGVRVAKGEVHNNIAGQELDTSMREMAANDCTNLALSFPQLKPFSEF
uniref:Secreted protein n=1 Tax=Angiostrongylus cantonensis TaxID=6313 RepID=A0A0K0DFI8_ANGCA